MCLLKRNAVRNSQLFLNLPELFIRREREEKVSAFIPSFIKR